MHCSCCGYDGCRCPNLKELEQQFLQNERRDKYNYLDHYRPHYIEVKLSDGIAEGVTTEELKDLIDAVRERSKTYVKYEPLPEMSKELQEMFKTMNDLYESKGVKGFSSGGLKKWKSYMKEDQSFEIESEAMESVVMDISLDTKESVLQKITNYINNLPKNAQFNQFNLTYEVPQTVPTKDRIRGAKANTVLVDDAIDEQTKMEIMKNGFVDVKLSINPNKLMNEVNMSVQGIMDEIGNITTSDGMTFKYENKPESENRNDSETCSCPTMDLMSQGCTCGAVARYNKGA